MTTATATATTETASFNLGTHNGTLTAENVATGEWRTFQIKTQPEDANFAPGERIAYLLTGADNENDFTGFAFVKDDGRLFVWKKKRGTIFDAYAKMLERPERYAKTVRFFFQGRCRRCNRKLTTPESVSAGIGPICAGR